MAGIGFTLARVAREGGLGGIAGAAAYGAVVSAGPWLLTAVAVAALQAWAEGALPPTDTGVVQAVLVYAFSLSALAAAPVGIVATRLVADRLFVEDPAAVPGIMAAALAIGGALALAIGTATFALAGKLPGVQALLATAILCWLAQLWIVSPLLTAMRRFRTLPLGYGAGIAVAVLTLWAAPPSATGVLAAVALGTATTVAALAVAVRREFRAAGSPSLAALVPAATARVAAAGIAGTVAIWIDKWILWWGPQSADVLGGLRLNPINDIGSFLGLLTMVPGLVLLLVVAETRFDRAFASMVARCTGTATLARIEEARADLLHILGDTLRILLIVQALAAAVAWVFAAPMLDSLGVDIRAVFAFRHTALGAVFHLLAIACSVVLSYYDLFGRICVTWAGFALASLLATLMQWDQGFAAFGWGYLAGAIMGAALGIALVAEASVNLTYLLFVGNNPSVVGSGGRWL